MRRAERGFTLLEITVALAVIAIAAFLLAPALTGALRWNASLAQRRSVQFALDSLADRFEAEEDSAWAVFTPPLDAYGLVNADGHELDFFLRDAQKRAHFWAYRYDKTSHRLARLQYGRPEDPPIEDGAPLTGIDDFFARVYPITALQDPQAAIYSPLYRDALLRPAEVRFDPERPWIAGGNQIVYVRFRSGQSARELQLSTQTAPSGFTIVLRYTPAPASSRPPERLTAAIVTAQVIGHWEDCPARSGCSNAEWPQYHWVQTTTSRSYESFDRGSTWTLFDTQRRGESGTSGPTGGDPPPPCQAAAGADYMRLCSPDWIPQAPPGTAGMDE